MIAAFCLSSGSILPIYFIAGWITPIKPRELDNGGDRQTRDFGCRNERSRKSHM